MGRFGSISSDTTAIAVADGGTGASTAAGARANLGVDVTEATMIAAGWHDVTFAAYGATGDGSTDDTTAVQDAIDAAAAAGGGIVYIPPGNTYAVGPLTAKANVVLSGHGAILERNTVAGSGDFGSATLHDAVGVDGFTVEGVTFDINGAVATPRRQLAFDGSTNLTVRDVTVAGLNGLWATWFRDCVGLNITGYRQDTGSVVNEDGIHLTGGRDVVIDNCIITSGDDCIALTAESTSGNTLDCTDVTISNCVLTSLLARPLNILVDGTNTTAIRDVAIANIVGTSGTSSDVVHIDDNTASGAGSGLVSRITLTNVEAASTAVSGDWDGISITNADDCTLIGTRVTSARRHGFLLKNADRANLVGCVSATTQTGSGFVVAGGGNEQLVGCTSISAATSGFTLGSASLGASANTVLVGCQAVSPSSGNIALTSTTGHRIIGGNLVNVLRETLTVAAGGASITGSPALELDRSGGNAFMNFRGSGTLMGRIHGNDGTYFALYYGAAPTLGLGIRQSTGAVYIPNEIEIDGALNHDGSTAGFMGATPVTRPTVTGSRGGNAALASVLTALANLGLITDSSS